MGFRNELQVNCQPVSMAVFMEIKPMKDKIEKAIKTLTDRASKDDTTADEALKFTQAALNLAHVSATFHNIK